MTVPDTHVGKTETNTIHTQLKAPFSVDQNILYSKGITCMLHYGPRGGAYIGHYAMQTDDGWVGGRDLAGCCI